MVSLHRRRGTAAAAKKRSIPTILLLAGVCFLVVLLGMLALFLHVLPSTTNNKKLAGVPYLLRGKVPSVPVPPLIMSGAAADQQQQQQEQREIQANFQQQQQLKPVVVAATNTSTNAQNMHLPYTTPMGPYPYPFEPVPSDAVIHYTPLGGMRFAEYTSGGAPYTFDSVRKQSDHVARSRRAHIKKTMQFAWSNYVEYALGADEILPQSGRGNNNWGGQGITLVDALDTLWLLNMTAEFQQARAWVAENLHHDQVNSMVSVFETTIRDLGGLLSAYDWSRDAVFLDHAVDLGERLLRAFSSSEQDFPQGQVNLQTGRAGGAGWTGGNLIIAEIATLQVEFRYLAKVTGRPELATRVERVFQVLHDMHPPNGLYPYYVRNSHGGPQFANDKLTFGAMADSLYEYMLKIWIQGGRTEPMYREMYDTSIDGMHRELLQTSSPSGLVYIADKNGGTLDTKMDHLVCFMGGLLALGAYTDPLGLDSARAQRDLRTAKALTYTCYQMYARMNTGISAEYVQFRDGQDFQIGRGAPHYLLRPEAVESMFVLNQLTGDPIYREWGWEIYQSVETFCKAKYGYGALSNVQDTHGVPRDSTESFFFAELMKYLYLLQDPDTQVDVLNKHVFNTEAHPLRIFPKIDEHLPVVLPKKVPAPAAAA